MSVLPTISIITAVLNGEQYLEGTIKSIIESNYINLEYIIIDGGSTDRTLNIIDKYRNSITKCISEPDNGISDAFNKGLRLASGDIIGIVSADDYLLKGALNKVAFAYSQNPKVDIIYGDAVFVEPYNKEMFLVRPDKDLNNLWKRQAIKHASTFVTNKCYQKYGLFDLSYKYAMDYELILRFYTQGASFIYIAEPLCAFRSGGLALSNPYKTISESKDISMKYGYRAFKAHPVYWLKAFKQFFRQIFTKLRWPLLVNFYRKTSRRFEKYNIELK